MDRGAFWRKDRTRTKTMNKKRTKTMNEGGHKTRIMTKIKRRQGQWMIKGKEWERLIEERTWQEQWMKANTRLRMIDGEKNKDSEPEREQEQSQDSTYYRILPVFNPYHHPRRNYLAKLSEIWYKDSFWHFMLAFQGDFCNSTSNSI